MNPALELIGVSKRFGGLQALSEVGLSARPEEILGLIGPNGAGKSTLVACITGVQRIDAGTIRFQGADIHHLPPHRRARKGISRTFQKVRLADPLTVYENVAAGLSASRFSRPGGWLRAFGTLSARSVAGAVDQALDRTGLGPVRQAQVRSLPFGQRHFVELARAIVAQPKLLLLDEPATGLTDPERDRLADLVRAIAAGGCAIVLIEHDLELIGRLCHNVTVINYGRRIFSGTPAQAQKDKEVIKAYLGENKELLARGGDEARG
jgi:ABC-type branched-subunit amino acid transport system ATPase component